MELDVPSHLLTWIIPTSPETSWAPQAAYLEIQVRRKTLIFLMENFVAVKNCSTGNARGRHSFSGKSTVEDPLNATNGGKPFGISELHIFPCSFSLEFFFLTHKEIEHWKFSTKVFPLVFLWPWGFLCFSFRFCYSIFLSSSGKCNFFGFLNISKHTQNKMLHNLRFYCSRLQLEPLSIDFSVQNISSFLFFFSTFLRLNTNIILMI